MYTIKGPHLSIDFDQNWYGSLYWHTLHTKLVKRQLPAPASSKNSASLVFCLLRVCKIDSKWSETPKNTKPAMPNFHQLPVLAAGVRSISHVEYVNTSYHTEFDQNLSINVACIHKRSFWSLESVHMEYPLCRNLKSLKKSFLNKIYQICPLACNPPPIWC